MKRNGKSTVPCGAPVMLTTCSDRQPFNLTNISFQLTGCNFKLQCAFFNIILQSWYLQKKKAIISNTLHLCNFKNEFSTPLSSSNYISHSARISWSLHRCKHVSSLLRVTLFSPVKETFLQTHAGIFFFSFLFFSVSLPVSSVCPSVCIYIHANDSRIP